MRKVDVSVVIVSFNTREVTRRCLEAVTAAVREGEKKGISSEIIAVDNGSTDGSVEMVKKNFVGVTLISLGKNTGFARGNNQGMKKAGGRIILLLNSDAFVKKETLVKVVQSLKENSQWGVEGCKLENSDGSIQPSAGFVPDPTNTLHWMLGIDKVPGLRTLLRPVHPAWEGFFARPREVGWVMGAFMAMKREVYEKTGGFDEEYFMYGEEVEWCKRMADAGFLIGYDPSFSVVHLGKASSNFDTVGPMAREIEGVMYLTRKHYPESLEWVGFVIRVGIMVRKIIFMVAGNRTRVTAASEILKKV